MANVTEPTRSAPVRKVLPFPRQSRRRASARASVAAEVIPLPASAVAPPAPSISPAQHRALSDAREALNEFPPQYIERLPIMLREMAQALRG